MMFVGTPVRFLAIRGAILGCLAACTSFDWGGAVADYTARRGGRFGFVEIRHGEGREGNSGNALGHHFYSLLKLYPISRMTIPVT